LEQVEVLGPTGRYFMKPSCMRRKLMSSIMTTNMNSTATAPTYTITRIIARNSAPIRMNNPAELKNARIRNRTECTGLRAEMTMTPDATVTIDRT
jgi:hypothetical protein